jgi:ATP-dependent phosphofructokinase / diphosphate-dependent phosphofructokinase
LIRIARHATLGLNVSESRGEALIKKIGILTGGGDCPGLNPAIRGVWMRAHQFGWDVVGIEEGWKGMVENISRPLALRDVEEIINQGGTILGSSRTNPARIPQGYEKVEATFKSLGLDALVVIGGDDTLGVAGELSRRGIPVVGIPKTMDNDLAGTDYTFGFDTAVTIAVDAVERLRDVARSHRRVMVLEVMGRKAGWVAWMTAMASGADWVLLPEYPENPEDLPTELGRMVAHLKSLWARGKKYAVVVISEGVELSGHQDSKDPTRLDAFGNVAVLAEKGLAPALASLIEEKTGLETRSAVIGHIQRGGPPTTFDRMLATRLGVKAAELLQSGTYGRMVCLAGAEISSIPLEEATAGTREVPLEMIELAKVFFQ